MLKVGLTATSCKEPELFPEEFARAATAILGQDLHIQKCDINITNANCVYLHLVNIFSS